MLWKMVIHKCIEWRMSSLELKMILITFATWRNLLLLVALIVNPKLVNACVRLDVFILNFLIWEIGIALFTQRTIS